MKMFNHVSESSTSLLGESKGGGGRCGEREVRGTGSDFRHAPDLAVRPYPKSKLMRRKESKETDSDSGRDSNPRPDKWPAML